MIVRTADTKLRQEREGHSWFWYTSTNVTESNRYLNDFEKHIHSSKAKSSVLSGEGDG